MGSPSETKSLPNRETLGRFQSSRRSLDAGFSLRLPPVGPFVCAGTVVLFGGGVHPITCCWRARASGLFTRVVGSKVASFDQTLLLAGPAAEPPTRYTAPNDGRW